jgi:hypothetical protein
MLTVGHIDKITNGKWQNGIRISDNVVRYIFLPSHQLQFYYRPVPRGDKIPLPDAFLEPSLSYSHDLTSTLFLFSDNGLILTTTPTAQLSCVRPIGDDRHTGGGFTIMIAYHGSMI